MSFRVILARRRDSAARLSVSFVLPVAVLAHDQVAVGPAFDHGSRKKLYVISLLVIRL